MMEEPINRKEVMAITIDKDQQMLIEDIAAQMIMTGSIMASTNPEENEISPLIVMTGAAMVDSLSEILSIVSGPQVTSEILTNVMNEVSAVKDHIFALREQGIDPTEWILGEDPTDENDEYDRWLDDDC